MAKHRRQRNVSKWNKPNYNTHHRLPKSRGGTNASSNLSLVSTELHNAYNVLFGSNPTAHEVASILSAHWIDPAYRLVVVRVEPLRAEDEEWSPS